MAASYAVIGSSRAARTVANLLDAPCVDRLEPGARDHLVMVASTPHEAMSVRSAVSQGIPLLAVVAWHLPEDSLGALADIGIPVFVGLEDRSAVDRLLDGERPPPIVREEASRLAVFEKLLAGRPRGELAPPQSD